MVSISEKKDLFNNGLFLRDTAVYPYNIWARGARKGAVIVDSN